MSARSQVESYIARVQRRLQLQATLRGLAILAALALTLTIALVLLLNRDAFPGTPSQTHVWAWLPPSC